MVPECPLINLDFTSFALTSPEPFSVETIRAHQTIRILGKWFEKASITIGCHTKIREEKDDSLRVFVGSLEITCHFQSFVLLVFHLVVEWVDLSKCCHLLRTVYLLRVVDSFRGEIF